MQAKVIPNGTDFARAKLSLNGTDIVEEVEKNGANTVRKREIERGAKF